MKGKNEKQFLNFVIFRKSRKRKKKCFTKQIQPNYMKIWSLFLQKKINSKFVILIKTLIISNKIKM